VTKNPAIPEFIKNTDALQVESIYLYHLKPWIGPFARFRLDTAMFAGTDVRPRPRTTRSRRPGRDHNADLRSRLRGSVRHDQAAPHGRLPASHAEESLGAFVQPYKSVPFNVEVRSALAHRRSSRTTSSPSPTSPTPPTTALRRATPRRSRLSSASRSPSSPTSSRLGLEANLEVWGTLYDEQDHVQVSTAASWRLSRTGRCRKSYTDAGGKDDVGQLTNIDLGANVNVKIVEWASLGYEFKAVRVPAAPAGHVPGPKHAVSDGGLRRRQQAASAPRSGGSRSGGSRSRSEVVARRRARRRAALVR
jgi:hypothetical protein